MISKFPLEPLFRPCSKETKGLIIFILGSLYMCMENALHVKFPLRSLKDSKKLITYVIQMLYLYMGFCLLSFFYFFIFCFVLILLVSLGVFAAGSYHSYINNFLFPLYSYKLFGFLCSFILSY